MLRADNPSPEVIFALNLAFVAQVNGVNMVVQKREWTPVDRAGNVFYLIAEVGGEDEMKATRRAEPAIQAAIDNLRWYEYRGQ